MMDYELVKDPRPDLPDTLFWTRLFLNILNPENKIESLDLHKLLWQLRCLGTVTRHTRLGIRFDPILEPDGVWESVEQFEEMKSTHLMPHVYEIRLLLDRVSRME